jgi:Tfp pilus assembly protein PilO
MATAIKLNSTIKQLEAAIKNKAVSKENIAKFKTQLDKAKSELAELQRHLGSAADVPRLAEPYILTGPASNLATLVPTAALCSRHRGAETAELISAAGP